MTVLAGSIYVGFGENMTVTAAIRFPSGSFYVNPPGVPHFVWTKEGVTVQITGVGPWQIDYVDSVEGHGTGKKP